MLDRLYRRPREIDEREIKFDARPKTPLEAAEQAIQDMKELPEPGHITFVEDGYLPAPPPPPAKQPLERIADLLRALTYGEMTELAADLWAVSKGEISEQNLPQILWEWAVSP